MLEFGQNVDKVRCKYFATYAANNRNFYSKATAGCLARIEMEMNSFLEILESPLFVVSFSLLLLAITKF